MMKIVISGFGKMGKEIFSILEKRDDVTLFTTEEIQSFDTSIAADSICIDFTTPSAFRNNYRFIADNFKATIVGTTGWNDIKDEVTSYFTERGKTMIYASNFSIGVNIFFEIARVASGLTAHPVQYDPYIIEYHHKFKLDSPSGTASTLREIVEKESTKSVDIQSVRSGYIPGIHKVGFESENDRIVIEHEAFSRRGFAEGAVAAALWSVQIKGVYDFRTILKEQFKKTVNYERD